MQMDVQMSSENFILKSMIWNILLANNDDRLTTSTTVWILEADEGQQMSVGIIQGQNKFLEPPQVFVFPPTLGQK